MSNVSENRTLYRLVPGKGYKLVGPPPMPALPLGEATACEPPSGTESETMHQLLPPLGREAPPTTFTWYADKKEWECFGQVGLRVGFTSTYLAAYGWTYGNPI
jgi:hypothetical protein